MIRDTTIFELWLKDLLEDLPVSVFELDSGGMNAHVTIINHVTEEHYLKEDIIVQISCTPPSRKHVASRRANGL